MGISRRVNSLVLLLLLMATAVPLLSSINTHAQNDDGAFSIQVTPSPIVDSIKPGVRKTIEFRVRNAGTRTEQLRVDLRKFKVNDNSEEIELTDEKPAEVSDWIKVASPTFSIDAGATFVEKLDINPPYDIGFSYSFVVLVSRDKEPSGQEAKTKIKGSVAIFTLLGVDRPGAVRKFEIAEFNTDHRLYEYLPVKFDVKLNNSGNTIVQPFGNIFIQRDINSSQPITVLKLNESGAYLLPNTTRTLSTSWTDGFPLYIEKKDVESSNKKRLVWDWSRVQNIRFGRYYGKLVAVYNDGQRDVPVEATISFWIIPWKILLIIILAFVILVIGIVTIIRKPIKSIKKKKHAKDEPEPEKEI